MTEFKWVDVSNEKAIKAKFTAVASSYAKVRAATHEALDVALRHAVQHGDGSVLTTLFNMLPENANKRGMLIWVREFSSLDLRKDKAGNAKFLGRDKDGKTSYTYEQEKARANPFWTLQRTIAENMPFQFGEAFEKLIQKGLRAIKEGKDVTAEDKAVIAWYSRHQMPKDYHLTTKEERTFEKEVVEVTKEVNAPVAAKRAAKPAAVQAA